MVESCIERYQLRKEIGQGTFSRVFSAVDISSGAHIAIKYPLDPHSSKMLLREGKVMSLLSTCTLIPRLIDFSRKPPYIAMEKLGKSLLQIHRKTRVFSVKTTAMVAIKAINALEELHSHGYLHNDIKADNLVTSRNHTDNRLYLIDFGLSSPYKINGTHVIYCENTNFKGSAFFSSMNNLRGIRSSRRDDLEALGYVLVYLVKGKLPWFDCKKDGKTSLDTIKVRRLSCSVEKLCEGLEPEFREFIVETQAIGFSDCPKYDYFRAKFARLVKRLGLELDWRYDWVEGRGLRKAVSTYFDGTRVVGKVSRRGSLPLLEINGEEWEEEGEKTPVAGVGDLPAFRFPRSDSPEQTLRCDFQAQRP